MRKKIFIIAVLAMSVASLGVLAGCGTNTDTAATTNEQTQTEQTQTEQTQTDSLTNTLPTVDKLEIKDIKKGKGKKAETGNVLSVVYKGTFMDGTPFDSNDKNSPFEFTLGTSEVIEGWDQGLQGMQVGGKRKLTIPAELAYGDQPNGTIPGGSTLVFDVELLDIK